MKIKFLILSLFVVIAAAFLGCIDSKNIPVSNETQTPPSEPVISTPIQKFSDQAFDESSGIFTKRWDAGNFAGFWRDPETGASTEALVINQSILNRSYRIIEKHNLIYTTRPVSVNYQVYRHTGKMPEGTEGFYSAIGWLGEKHVFLKGNRIARIIFEQNTTEEKSITIGESLALGEGYFIVANSIDAKAASRQGWFVLYKDNAKLEDMIVAPGSSLTYRFDKNESTPIFISYAAGMRSLRETDAMDFKHMWMRSRDVTEIKKGQIYGIMEVTNIKNDLIELKNKEPIDLAPGKIIDLMGNLSIEVGNSSAALQFYPNSTLRYKIFPSLFDTISVEHPILKTHIGVNEALENYYLRDYIKEGAKYTISAYPKQGGFEEKIIIILHGGLTEGVSSIEIITPEGEEITPKVVAVGNWSGYKNQTFVTINSREEWNNVWEKHASYLTGQKPSLPEINFTNETVVAVFFGESPAYDVELINITKAGRNIFVNLQKKYPASRSSVQPYFIVRLSETGENIVFRTLKWEYINN